MRLYSSYEWFKTLPIKFTGSNLDFHIYVDKLIKIAFIDFIVYKLVKDINPILQTYERIQYDTPLNETYLDISNFKEFTSNFKEFTFLGRYSRQIDIPNLNSLTRDVLYIAFVIGGFNPSDLIY